MRRIRTAWLLETRDPAGSAVMALRRLSVLRDRLASTALALSGGSAPVPASSPLHDVLRSGSLTGEVRIARAQLVVTTTQRTLVSAAPRLQPGTRLVHFVHTSPEIALSSEWFMRAVPRVARLVLPIDVDTTWFAGQVGLSPDRVVTADDFTLPDESLLGTARAKVIVAAGRLDGRSGILDIAEAFRLASPHLPGWQLRVAGGGPARPDLLEFVDRHQLGQRLLVLGPRHDLAMQYLDAGLVLRIETADACGLSVLEGLAAGVPVLGSDATPAVRRHVRHGVNGWVLGRVDPTAIAEALVTLSRPDVRAPLAEQARAERAGLLTDAGARELHDLIDAALDTVPERGPR